MTEKPEKRLLPTILDDRARDTPDRVYASVPKTGKLNDGYRDISYRQVANASNRVAWWLERETGKSTTFETIAYIGPIDLRYVFLVIAAAKVGYKILLPLPSNTQEAQVELLEATACKFVIAPKEMQAQWYGVRQAIPRLKSLIITSFDDLIDGTVVAHYPYSKTYDEGKNDPLHIAHTSGTTGNPKPIVYTQRMAVYFYNEVANSTASNPSASLLFMNRRVFDPIPPSWLFGLVMILYFPLGFNSIPVLVPTDAPMPLTASYIDTLHQAVEVDGGIYVPDTLVQLSKNPAYLATMRDRGLKFIIFSGAPLPKEVGDVYAKFLKVQPYMGSSEIGPYSSSEADPDDWQYYRFVDGSDFEFEEFDAEKGLYELVVKKNPDEEKKQNVFRHFPELTEFRTKDLWREHATKKGRWLYSGRTDDFVKLGSLTKFWASHAEKALEKLPGVRGVLMAGDERPQPFILVDLELENGTNEEKIGSIWSDIEEVNKGMDDEIRIRKELVLLTKPEKPMRRSGKSTVLRRETLNDYEAEIQELYEKISLEDNGGSK